MPTYIGSTTFGSEVTWAKIRNYNWLVSAPHVRDDTPPTPATCTVVGIVSPVPLFLEPHGTYNPIFGNSILEASRLQFQLLAPTLHPGFNADFDFGLEQIRKLQDKVTTEGSKPERFVVVHNETGDGVINAFEFSWPLFAERVCTHIFSYPTFKLTLIWIMAIKASPYNRTSSLLLQSLISTPAF
jgi:hypothetical protein